MRIVGIIIFTFLVQIVFGNIQIDSLKSELNKTENKAAILSQIADKYIYISSDLAEDFANQAIIQALVERDTNIFAEIYRIKGIVKYNRSEIDSSFYYFYKSAEVSRNINNIYDQASTLVDIGALFLGINELDKSEKTFTEALQLFSKSDSKKGMSTVYNNLALVYQQKENYEKAIEYFLKSKKVKDSINDKLGGAKLLVNIANIYRLEYKKYDKSLSLLYKALQIFTELRSDIFISITYNTIGNVFFDKEEFNKARTNALTALSFAEKGNFNKEKSKSYELLFKIYKIENDYRKALEYYMLLEKYNKEQLSEKNNKLLQDTRVKYEILQKEEQLKLNEIQLASKTKQLTYLLVFILILLVLLFYVFIQKHRMRIANKDLVKKNIEIVQSEIQFKDTQDELEAIIENIKSDKSELNKEITKSVTIVANEDELLDKINKCMDEEKMYLNKDLTTVLLAQKLNTNKTYISKVINDNFDKNFSTFVNEYRIKYARKLLAENMTKKYTIEYISRTSGFNSITAFNKAFKKYTGVTPSFFIKNLDNNL